MDSENEPRAYKASITKIDEIKVQLSMSNDAPISRLYLRKNEILFRNGPAPEKLIKIATCVICYISKNIIVKAEIDPFIKFNILYGLIIKVNEDNTFQVGNEFITDQINIQELSTMNNSRVLSENLNDLVGQFLQIVRNHDAFIDAKLLGQDYKIRLNLKPYKKDSNGDDEVLMLRMQDDKKVEYFIDRKALFYKNTENEVTEEDFLNSFEKEVSIFIKDNKLRAELNIVQLKDWKNSEKKNFEDAKVENKNFYNEKVLKNEKNFEGKRLFQSNIIGNYQDFNPNFMHMNSSNLVFSIVNPALDDKKTSFFSNITTDASEVLISNARSENESSEVLFVKNPNSENELFLSENYKIQPFNCKRIKWENFYFENSSYFTLENQKLFENPKITLLLGLFESIFRINNTHSARILKEKLVYYTKKFYSDDFNGLIDFIFERGKNIQNDPSERENLYYLIYNNYEFFDIISARIFQNSINYASISSEFCVFINLICVQNSEFYHFHYTPKAEVFEFPVLSIFYSDKIFLVYSESLMKFDGFNTETLNFSLEPKEYLWPVLYFNENFVNKIFRILEKISSFRKNFKGGLTDDLKKINEKASKLAETMQKSIPKSQSGLLSVLEKIRDPYY